jgi:hypothetical protein
MRADQHKFALGVDIINVIAEAGRRLHRPATRPWKLVDRFAWHMRNVEGVQQVMTLPMAAKIVNAGWNEGNDAWRACRAIPIRCAWPRRGFETDSGLLNSDCSAMPIMAFLPTIAPTTIDRVVGGEGHSARRTTPGTSASCASACKRLRRPAAGKGEEFRTDQVNLRLATGNVGVMAAINDTVRAVEHPSCTCCTPPSS